MSTKRFRSIRTYANKYVYLDLELRFAARQNNNDDIEVREFKLIIINAIDSLFGEFGSKMLFDILKYRKKDCRAFIRLMARDYVKFRLGLTLLNEWKEMSCQFIIHKASLCLASLVVPISIQDNLVNIEELEVI